MNYSPSHQDFVSEFAADRRREKGSATVIIVLLLLLISAFVALALSRNIAEAMITNNDQSSTRSFYAAQAGLETMTRNFNKIFDTKFNPTLADITRIQDQNHWPRGFEDFTFDQKLARLSESTSVAVLPTGPFEGMTALQDRWKLTSTALNQNGNGQVQMTRNILNNRIPIFQFAAFYDGDFECHPGPRFSIDGRVHTNGNMYIEAGWGGSYYKGKVTAAGEIVSGRARNGWGVFVNNPGWISGQVFITDGQNNFQRLYGDNNGPTPGGSVLEGPDLDNSNPDVPDGVRNPQWSGCYIPNVPCKPDNDVFNGNLMAHVKQLKLPLKKDSPKADNIEVIRRGTAADVATPVLADSRYFNKPGIRVSLSDSQTELPGGSGGVRLDGAGTGDVLHSSGSRDVANLNTIIADGTRGYAPLPMIDGYSASRLNGNRLYTGISYDGQNRQTWIKIERVNIDPITSVHTVSDITQDFLSLGVTEKGPCVSGQLIISDPGYCTSNGADSRSILKMQRYTVPGGRLNAAGATTVGGKPLYTYAAAAAQSFVSVNNYLLPNENTAASASTYRTLVVGTQSGGNSSTDLSSVNPTSSQNGYGEIKLNRSTDDQPLTLSSSSTADNKNLGSSQTFSTGLGVHAYSELNYDLAGQYTDFQAKIGIDRDINRSPCIEYNWGSVQFQVLVDGSSVYQSPVKRINDAFTQLNIPVNGANSLTLRVTDGGDGGSCDHADWADAKLAATNSIPPAQVLPVPIEMFDTREGLYSEDVNTDAVYPGTVPTMGVMSVIDVDVANFRRFIRGEYDGQFVGGLKSSQIQTDNGGWILYVSDRRGDRDNDGEFDMENIYVDLSDPNGNNDGNTKPQFGENANHSTVSGAAYAGNNIPLSDNKIETDYDWEAARYVNGMDYTGISWAKALNPDSDLVNPATNQHLATVPTDMAALFDHKNYRRAVRLINGTTLPSVNVNGTEVGGFTLATENGAYLAGNYNTTGIIGGHPYGVSTSPSNYTGTNFPSSIASDAVTLLSSNWKDGNSFYAPFNPQRKPANETTYRTALLVGNTMSSLWINNVDGAYSQGSAHYRLNGALHEGIVRTLENWGGVWMNYCGSFVNLFNSHNHNGSWKLGGAQHVFGPQDQNRTFDTTFLNPNTVPPGTPFFQYVQVMAFRRNNE